MSELLKYIIGSLTLSDTTRLTLTSFLIYLVCMEGTYTGIAIGIIYFRYEFTTFVDRWKRDLINTQMVNIIKNEKTPSG